MSIICGNTGAPVGKNCKYCRVNCWIYREWENMNKSEQMAFRGIITKLPRDSDPNFLIKNEMQNKYGKCPFCGNERMIDSFLWHVNGGDEVARMGHEERYGRQHRCRFWEEKHHWRIDHWHCYKCGASWDSEEYPTDIKIPLTYKSKTDNAPDTRELLAAHNAQRERAELELGKEK